MNLICPYKKPGCKKYLKVATFSNRKNKHTYPTCGNLACKREHFNITYNKRNDRSRRKTNAATDSFMRKHGTAVYKFADTFDGIDYRETVAMQDYNIAQMDII